MDVRRVCVADSGYNFGVLLDRGRAGFVTTRLWFKLWRFMLLFNFRVRD